MLRIRSIQSIKTSDIYRIIVKSIFQHRLSLVLYGKLKNKKCDNARKAFVDNGHF